MNNNYKELVDILEKDNNVEIHNGTEVVVKKIPDSNKPGVFDSRVKEITTRAPFLSTKDEEGLFVYEGIPIGAMRKSMGFDNLDISEGHIETTYKTIKGSEADIDIRIYTPKDLSKKAPCVVFFHGGGFFGGAVDVVENPCKSIAYKSNAVVVSVDYRLAPEHKYPSGLTDCFDVVKWVYNHGDELNVDINKIGVSGDSAGGNLSACCSIKDRDLGTNMIKFQALIYPAVTLASHELAGYTWTVDDYEIYEDRELIEAGLYGMKNSSDLLHVLYLGEINDLTSPYISPLSDKDFARLPKTLMVTAEFDFLRTQGEVYGKKLREAGGDVKIIRYKGTDHAFIDKCGVYPQAEDCYNEIAKMIAQLN